MASARTVRLAVDIGGTFTDVALDAPAGRVTVKVLTTPDARPESSGVASDMARVIMAVNIRPAPTPNSTIAGRMSVRYCPSTGARVIRTSPTRTSASPGTSTVRGPNLVMRRSENPSDSVPMPTETGRNASPVWMAS